MIKAIFNVMINMMASLIQVIMIPFNRAIINHMPELGDKLLEITTTINTIFDAMTWGLGLLPESVINTLLFIITVEIAKHTIFISTHALIKVWNLFQKIKFW